MFGLPAAASPVATTSHASAELPPHPTAHRISKLLVGYDQEDVWLTCSGKPGGHHKPCQRREQYHRGMTQSAIHAAD